MCRFHLFFTIVSVLQGLFLCAQTNIMNSYDSLLLLPVDDSRKSVLLDHFIENNVSASKDTLALLYYKNARWNWSKKLKAKGFFYALKEREIRASGTQKDPEKKNLYNLGYMSSRLSNPDYEAAIMYFDTLISISDPNEVRLGNVYRERGDLFDNIGDFQRALENYEQSERILQASQKNHLLIKTYINTAATYVNTADSTYLNPFLETVKKIYALDGLTIPDKQHALLQYNTGAMYNTTGNFRQALRPTEEALALFKLMGDSTRIIKSLSLLGVIHTKMKRFKDAAAYFDRAAIYAGKDPYYKSYIQNNRADLFLMKKEYQKAIAYYHKAIYSILNLTDPVGSRDLPPLNDISISPHKRFVLEYVMDLTNCHLQRFKDSVNNDDLHKAEQLVTLADHILDELYFESREEHSKLYWRRKGSELYTNAVKICYLLDKPENALYFIEKNKGLLLLESITTAKARRYGNIPVDIINREQQLLKHIKLLEKDLISYEQKAEGQDLNEVKQEIFAQKNNYKKFIDSLELKYPKYYNYKKALSIIELNDVRRNLDRQEYILSYILGKSEGYVLLISRDAVQLKKIDNISLLYKNVLSCLQLIKQPFVNQKQVFAFEDLAQAIYKMIVPFSVVEKNSQVKINIIPDGILQYLPFEVLIPDKTRSGYRKFLIYQTDIRYNYSLSLPLQSGNDIGFKNEDNASAGFVLGNFKNAYLPPLINAEYEQTSLTPYFKSNMLFDSLATKQHFLEAYDSHKIIHISTHGGVDHGNPWLALYDKKLLFDELYFLKSIKEMVVLSACKTSLGEHKRGEGIYNLTRGFINSGSRSVVSTLWETNEKASTEILSEFYKQLKKGKAKSEALRSAKLKYLEANNNTSEFSPYYWGAIIVTGNNNPIYESPFWYYFLIPFILIGAFLFYKVFIYRKFQKNQSEETIT